MLERAQDLIKRLQERTQATLRLASDIAEAVGMPSWLTGWMQGAAPANWPNPSRSPALISSDTYSSDEACAADATCGSCGCGEAEEPRFAESGSGAKALPEDMLKALSSDSSSDSSSDPPSEMSSDSAEPKKRSARATRRRPASTQSARGAAGKLPDGVRPLRVEAEIDGSTYLARIVWALGVSRIEGTGALRPADIARMVMARSAVSLEPPNVARYIRRRQPSCLAIDRSEGGSNFFKLNAAGRRLFDEHFQGD